jgi:uncharacterized membrane protein YoaK (UPF0700 family)
MMHAEKIPAGFRPYLPIFLAIYFLTFASAAAALFGVVETLGVRDVGVLHFALMVCGTYVVVQNFFVMRAHPRALSSLVMSLLIFFICTLLTLGFSPKTDFSLVTGLPSLIALWLLNTRRFRGLWKRLCVMRRRRTRQRRLIRQLKRTRRR